MQGVEFSEEDELRKIAMPKADIRGKTMLRLMIKKSISQNMKYAYFILGVLLFIFIIVLIASLAK